MFAVKICAEYPGVTLLLDFGGLLVTFAPLDFSGGWKNSILYETLQDGKLLSDDLKLLKEEGRLYLDMSWPPHGHPINSAILKTTKTKRKHLNQKTTTPEKLATKLYPIFLFIFTVYPLGKDPMAHNSH